MTDHLIERAAKAGWEANRKFCETEAPDLEPWDEAPEKLRENWRRIASAVIVANQDPIQDAATAAMRETLEFAEDKFSITRSPVRLSWPALNAKFQMAWVNRLSRFNDLGA